MPAGTNNPGVYDTSATSVDHRLGEIEADQSSSRTRTKWSFRAHEMSKNMIMLWTLGYWALGLLHDQLIISIGMSASAVNFLETAFDTVALALVAWILNRSDVRSEFIRIWTTPKEVSKLIVATVLISVKQFSTKHLLVDRGPWVTELAKGTVVILVLCIYPYRKNLPYWAAISSCLIVFGLLLMEDGKKLNLTGWIITIGLLDVGSAHYSARIHKSSLITMLAQAPVQLLTSLAIWWFSGFSMAKNSDESIALWKVGFLVSWALVFHYFSITITKIATIRSHCVRTLIAWADRRLCLVAASFWPAMGPELFNLVTVA